MQFVANYGKWTAAAKRVARRRAIQAAETYKEVTGHDIVRIRSRKKGTAESHITVSKTSGARQPTWWRVRG
jgi:hypothetical protein